MTPGRFAPRARRELCQAAEWIAEDNPAAAEALLQAALRAAARVAARPGLGHVRLELAPARFRFWPLRGLPYVLVLDCIRSAPVVARVVHQARDLPTALADLECIQNLGGGDHAAAVIDLRSSLAGQKPGWRWRNASSSASCSTAIRTSEKGCTVIRFQRICCLLCIRLATISLTALSTNAVEIAAPPPRRLAA